MTHVEDNAQNNEKTLLVLNEESRNQETELVAMVDDVFNLTPKSPQKPATTTLTSKATPPSEFSLENSKTPSTMEETPQKSHNNFANFAVPATPTSSQLVCSTSSAGSSLKKKRNKTSSKRLPKQSNVAGSIYNESTPTNIKTSLSMTSLPPDEEQESRDVIKAQLKVDRPYNSLKVCTAYCCI